MCNFRHKYFLTAQNTQAEPTHKYPATENSNPRSSRLFAISSNANVRLVIY